MIRLPYFGQPMAGRGFAMRGLHYAAFESRWQNNIPLYFLSGVDSGSETANGFQIAGFQAGSDEVHAEFFFDENNKRDELHRINAQWVHRCV
jgi:hypothetical protein